MAGGAWLHLFCPKLVVFATVILLVVARKGLVESSLLFEYKEVFLSIVIQRQVGVSKTRLMRILMSSHLTHEMWRIIIDIPLFSFTCFNFPCDQTGSI